MVGLKMTIDSETSQQVCCQMRSMTAGSVFVSDRYGVILTIRYKMHVSSYK